MMSLETMRSMNEERAKVAKSQNLVPYWVTSLQDIETLPGGSKHSSRNFPFPNIGSYEPDGYTEIDELFVDSSGLGADDEPALTINQLNKRLVNLYNDHGEFAAAITGAGQFQIYITIYKRSTE